MTKKKWVYVEFDDCPRCGDMVEILTESDDDDENLFYDGDDARCVSCDIQGSFSVDSDDESGYINWED